ncbi:HV01 protein, partial [Amia calva]|nr:HV01 protein [Amia calva]
MCVFFCLFIHQFIFILIAGVESNPNIIQTPPTANLGERESVTFHCNLEDGEMGSYYMYWYRQHQSRAPEFIYREGDHYGQGFGERFVAKLESSNNKFSLHIKNALIEDSAIYYCAARALCLNYWGLQY